MKEIESLLLINLDKHIEYIQDIDKAEIMPYIERCGFSQASKDRAAYILDHLSQSFIDGDFDLLHFEPGKTTLQFILI